MGKAPLGMLAATCVAALFLTTPAQAETLCAHWHGDPASSYTGPLPVGILCQHSYAPSTTWTVPDDITNASFYVFGASDPVDDSPGGRVEASLNLTSGSELTLEMGGPGEASAVRLGEEPLIVAGGGDGQESNFVTPSAVVVESIEPGDPNGSDRAEGAINVEWTYFYEGTPKNEGTPKRRPRAPEPIAKETELPILSTQPPACIVPPLRGLRPVRARRILAAANCTLGDVSRRAARRSRRGRIVKQSLPSGTTLDHGAVIDVVVGRRP